MGTLIAGYELGMVPDSALPADIDGWSRDGVDYGNEIGGDEALTSAWSARYFGPDGKAWEVSYYVYGDDPDVVGPENVTYGVVEYVEELRVDESGDRVDSFDGEREDRGLAPSFDTLEAANGYARSQCLIDSRWWFGPNPMPR